MIVAVLPALAALAAGPAVQTCRLERSIGRVDELRPVARRSGPEPVVTAPGGNPHRLRPDDLLCGGDVVVNPAGSGIQVMLRLGSRVVRVDPGRTEPIPDPFLRIPFPSIAEFFDSFRKYNADRETLHEGSPRGIEVHSAEPGRTCSLIPPAQPTGDNFVLRDRPVYLSWTCTRPQTRFTATIAAGGSSRTLDLAKSELRLDPRQSCPATCVVTLRDSTGARFSRLRLSSAGRDALGGEAALLRTSDPRAAALLASRLLNRAPWALAGASMLRDQACDFPPAAAAALDLYEAEDVDELCPQNGL